eukprot:5148407-Prymnesium_polylepis.1
MVERRSSVRSACVTLDCDDLPAPIFPAASHWALWGAERFQEDAHRIWLARIKTLHISFATKLLEQATLAQGKNLVDAKVHPQEPMVIWDLKVTAEGVHIEYGR